MKTVMLRDEECRTRHKSHMASGHNPEPWRRPRGSPFLPLSSPKGMKYAATKYTYDRWKTCTGLFICKPFYITSWRKHPSCGPLPLFPFTWVVEPVFLFRWSVFSVRAMLSRISKTLDHSPSTITFHPAFRVSPGCSSALKRYAGDIRLFPVNAGRFRRYISLRSGATPGSLDEWVGPGPSKFQPQFQHPFFINASWIYDSLIIYSIIQDLSRTSWIFHFLRPIVSWRKVNKKSNLLKSLKNYFSKIACAIVKPKNNGDGSGVRSSYVIRKKKQLLDPSSP